MSKVVDIQELISVRQHAQAEAEIADIQARVSAAIQDRDNPVMAVYALIAAALCVSPDGRTPGEWRQLVERTFQECCAIIHVEREDQ
ncbi:hypothetical protein [Stutzerimonas nitrititolerans]|uniref:hypothetical protein n=1 Tax=Stutzerimonas nitrititolerans TaxID=2482751 RepID=UPI0028A714C2|nr:hypothetical protein [Stutzerimonas nitrititolerans]